jgi:hypothetical protein
MTSPAYNERLSATAAAWQGQEAVRVSDADIARRRRRGRWLSEDEVMTESFGRSRR